MKRILLSFMVVMISLVGAFAQYTYDVTYYNDGGNPGGINTNSDATTTG